MLEIYAVIRGVLRELRPVVDSVERRDPDLGRQMRRAGSSILLNVGEGTYSQGRNQAARYHTAMGSASETLACMHVAIEFGYVEAIDAEVLDQLDRIIATLRKLVRTPRR